MLQNFSGDNKLLFYVVTDRMARMGCVLLIILKNIFYYKKTAQTDFKKYYGIKSISLICKTKQDGKHKGYRKRKLNCKYPQIKVTHYITFNSKLAYCHQKICVEFG